MIESERNRLARARAIALINRLFDLVSADEDGFTGDIGVSANVSDNVVLGIKQRFERSERVKSGKQNGEKPT